MSDPGHAVAHTASLSALVATIFGWVPPIIAFVASVVALAYYVIQVYESETFQRLKLRWQTWRKRPVKLEPDQDDPNDLGFM